MQVSVESTGGLQRRMTVDVPKERVDEEYMTRLKTMARQTRLNGFRPGKVPVRVIQQRFGIQVRDEVVQEVVRTSLDEAARQEQLRIAGEPQLEQINDKGVGQNLGYTVSFEIYPEIGPLNLEGISVEKPVVEITQQDIDNMVETLRKQRQIWHVVERPAQVGDRLVTDYTGILDGESLTGDTPQQQTIIPGSGLHLKDVEDGLIGAKAGSVVEIDAVFPQDYSNPAWAGKTAHFSVTVQRVEEGALPPVNEAFAATFGVTEGGLAVMREEIRLNLINECKKATNNRIKKQLFDALLAANPVEVPKTLIQGEAANMAENTANDMRAKGIQVSNPLDPERFLSAAELRVKIGFLVGEIVMKEDLTPDPQKVREMLEGLASTYDNPREFIEWHYAEEGRLANIEAAVLEDMATEILLERINVIEIPMSFDELMEKQRRTE
jgi:trigger factor